MITILTGLVGGLFATVAMTGFMLALGDDSPPPTAALWAKYVGDEGPEAYVAQGMALHFVYGITAGGVLAVAVSALGLGTGALADTLLWALAYSGVLLVVGALFWLRLVLALEPEPAALGSFTLFHVVYGVVLGATVLYTPV